MTIRAGNSTVLSLPTSKTKPFVYYVCPGFHRILIFNSSHAVHCQQCAKIIDKSECQRRRHYPNGNDKLTKLCKREKPKPELVQRQSYNRKYYLMRKFNMPRRIYNHKKDKQAGNES